MGCALPFNKVVQSPQVLIGSEGDLSNNALFGSDWLGTTGRWPIATLRYTLLQALGGAIRRWKHC